jgi:RNA polymerase sigma-70 factor (ECF subfamily)
MSEPIHGELLEVPPDRSRRRELFDDFYAAELPRLVALARGLCGAALAEDVTQEAMLAAYRRWREVGGLEHPEQWVRRTCANLADSQFRRRMVELRLKTRLSIPRPPPDQLSDTAEEIWAAVRALPHRQAQAAALRFVYDLPIAEIARTLDCSEGTVEQHLSRARNALATALDVERGGVMRLDELARTASDELVERRAPDVGAALTELKATRRRRNTGRVVAAGLAMAVVAAGWAVLSSESGNPEPVEPTVRNGALVVVSSRYLLIVEPGEKELTRPTNLEPFTDLAFTADGDEMVYQAPRRQLVARDVMTGEERLLGHCDPTAICRPALSPDEQWLAIPAEDSIVLQRVGGGVGPRLADLGVVYDVSWSPDGTALAVTSTKGLQLLASDGSSRKTLVPYDPGRFAFDVAWSPDGSSIAFIEIRPHEVGANFPPSSYALRLVNPDGRGRGLAGLGDCRCLGVSPPSFAWAPDGSEIAYTRAAGPLNQTRADGVHLIRPDGTGQQRLNHGTNGNLAWQPIVTAD